MSRHGDVGRFGENIAADFLHKKGYSILERNYRKPFGEIDIVARKGRSLHFIEVKSGVLSRENISRENALDPADNAHASKLRKVRRTAEAYMMEKGETGDVQIDLVVVYVDLAARRARCLLHEQVLE